ncbi:MAG: hypothetical protein KatS3mg121_0723 [Gammaproteobacteria bacterium]|nr:MAG: hypothetical protein KatS3mg121_0723 [Gammaproteobacteria bacterium]
MTDIVPVRRALLSVSDKTGLIELAQALHGHGVELLSTGGTARALREAGLPVREVSDHTGFPEIMDGRVKTLHPKIHGGLLGRRGVDETVMAEHDIAPIDLLVVNLYPFERTVADPACDDAAAVENIDVGGPAMLRAAAKNHDRVAVLTDPADYPAFLDELGRAGGTRFATRRRLAAKAFARTAAYDAAIARWLEARLEPGGAPFPERLLLAFERREALRYGENPHQRAAFYVEPAPPADSLAAARLRQGKPLSFNNLADADAAWRCVRGFAQPACVIVKHANPCGVAVARDPPRAPTCTPGRPTAPPPTAASSPSTGRSTPPSPRRCWPGSSSRC